MQAGPPAHAMANFRNGTVPPCFSSKPCEFINFTLASVISIQLGGTLRIMGFIWNVQSGKMSFIVVYLLLHLPKCVQWPHLSCQEVLPVDNQELPL